MLNRIIRFALDNRPVVLACSALLMVGGLYSASTTDVDVFPDLNAPTVVVMTEAEGMAAEEVERLVTFPVETALNGATSVRRVRSSSTNGFSNVSVEFDWGTDIYIARQVVSEKIAMLAGELPAGVGTPTLGPQSSILGEMLIIGLTADETSLEDLRTIADWTIRPRLLSTGGVAQAAVMGGDIKEYQILLRTRAMKHYGVSLDEVLDAVEEMNLNASGGTLYEYGNEYIVRGMLSSSDIAQLGQSLVKVAPDGTPVLLDDVARIRTGGKTPLLGIASYNGKSAVVMTVTKQPNVSTIELTDKIETALSDLSKTLPSDVEIHTDIFRQADFIENSIDNVKKSLLEGAFFVVLVLFIFLMNWRTTVISLVSLPLSICITLIVLKLFGLTVNTMTLGGIAIAIGSLVDDSIVDVENVFKRLRQNRKHRPEERLSTLETVFEASKEVRMPMFNSTLIIVACFLPLFFLSGMEGRMLIPLGIAFVISLFASTLVALTLTPVLCTYLLKDRHIDGDRADKDPWVVVKLRKVYGKTLDWSLAHKGAVLGGTGVLLAVAVVYFCLLGRSFLPSFNEGSLTIAVSTVPGISIEESDRIGRMAENILLTVPEISCVGRRTGRAELSEHSFGVNTSEFDCPYTLRKRSKSDMLSEIRSKLAVLPGVNIEIGGPIAHRMDEMLSGTKASIAIKLFGTDLNRMYSLGNQIKAVISGIDGITDLNVEQQVERPELVIEPNRTSLAQHGITMAEFGRAVSVLLEGRSVSQVYEGNRSFDLTLKVEDGERASIESLGDILIADGVPLSSVATIRSSSGPNSINRENVSRKLVISCNVESGGLSRAVKEIQKRIDAEISLPEGYHIEYGGQFESEERASKTIALISVFSIIIIFLLLYGEFKDSRQTLVVLLNLPLALIGGVICIALTDGMLSIPAIIGFISLFGIATRNGMLLIDRYNVLYGESSDLQGSVRAGSLDRLNPILMTAITSALALLPLALGGDLPGNEIQSPMAKVILGGLVTSTVLNGYIIPIMYIFISRKK